MITMTLPGLPPSKNRMHDHSSGRPRASADFQAYKEEVMMIAPPVDTLTGPLFIDIAVYLPNNRRDVHNCTDTLLDALQYAGLVQNDRQFKWVLTRNPEIDRENPRVEVTIGALGEWEEYMRQCLAA